MVLDKSFAQPILKELTHPDKVNDTINNTNRFLSMVPKFTGAEGDTMRVVFRYGHPETISSTFSDALNAAAIEASKFGKVNVDYVSKFGLAHIDGDVIARCGDNKGAYIKAVKDQMDSVMLGLGNRRAQELIGAGWGDVGTVKTGTVSGATLQLANPRQARKIEKGQVHVFSTSLNGAVLRSGTLTVLKVARDTGTITYSAACSTVGVSNGDTVFNKGDRQDSATPSQLCLTGLEAWIPPAGYDFSSDSFWGLNRGVDPTRLAGQRLDRSDGTPLEEIYQDADTQVCGEGGALDTFLVSPDTFADTAKALGSRVRYQQNQVGKIGFSSLMIVGQSGDISIVADRWVPNNRIYGLTLNSWELCSAGPLVKVISDDNSDILRNSTKDGVEVRMVSRLAQLACHAPAYNINITI